MKIHIKNIGMLDEAEFEIGDLTLICGENNTGKTYATYSLYGYLDFMGNGINPAFFEVIRNVIKKYSEFIDIHECVAQTSTENLKNIFKTLLETIQKEYQIALSRVLAGKEDDFNQSVFEDNLVDNFSNFMENIETDENQEKINKFFGSSTMFEIVEINNEIIKFSYEKSKSHFTQQIHNDVEFKKQSVWIAFVSYIFSLIYPKPFILSAERTGAAMFQKELDVNKNEIVDKISQVRSGEIERAVVDLLTKRYSRYPKPVKDNIYFVRELEEVAKNMSFIQKEEKDNPLCKKIIDLLHRIVGGKYIIGQGGIKFAPGAKKRATRGKFFVQRASSSVRSLLMLHFYILHVAKQNDILMIDEPELNLHPKNQILLARLFALLANAGIKIFITTHSDYIVRELSNCIMLYNLEDTQIEKLKKQGYAKEYRLESGKVKAYLAENVRGKNILSPASVTQKQGIFMTTFDEPIDSQNENQGLIFEMMQYKVGNNDK